MLKKIPLGFLVAFILILACRTDTTYFTLCFAQSNQSEINDQFAELEQTIEESIKAEKASLAQYQEQLKRFENERIYIAAAVNGYQVQLSTYGNLIMATGVDITSISKAMTELQASRRELQKLVNESEKRLETVSAESDNVDQQQALAAKQLSDLSKLQTKDQTISPLYNKVKNLSNILDEKKKLVNQFSQIVNSRFKSLSSLATSFETLTDHYASTLEQRKKQHLYQRQQSILSASGPELLAEEIDGLRKIFLNLIQPKEWGAEIKALWKSAGFILVPIVLFITFTLGLIRKLKSNFSDSPRRSNLTQLGFWHSTVIQIIERSHMLLGATVLIYVCSRMDIIYIATPEIRLLAYLLWVALVVKWLGLIIDQLSHSAYFSSLFLRKIKRLQPALLFFFSIHLVLGWVLESSSVLLQLVRIGFDVWVLYWAFGFRHDIRSSRPETSDDTNQRRIIIAVSCTIVGYAIGGVALIMDLIGYGPFAVHWLFSWGRSAVVLFWLIAVFFLLSEWDQHYKSKSREERDELIQDEYPIQWLMIRAFQLLCCFTLIVAIILAWGGQQSILTRIYQGLGYQLKIGNMSFSLLGLIYAVLVLLVTNGVSRLWRWILQSKFLSQSDMEIGLKDTITTVNVYIIWMLGILIALHVFGLSGTSLAVTFGALGIGLGFGLQNIFSNFISGIILLFERPIQVGDDVEINGVWATVKKINVRSTVVQTYDNASLIIPNSEFISQQVTNWSFKDKRLRRNVVVGVAYGSDTALVKESLLEIAKRTPRILKHPEPDVLFTDFGDSALMFRLRIWTDIDNMLKAESAVRFEIDNVFRERGIEIAFPQRDIHIKSNDHKSRLENLDHEKDQ